MKQSYIFLATGFEEIEALSTVDIMRRAQIPVVMVSITGELDVVGAHGVTVKADALYQDISVNDADWLIAPGGMPGSQYLHEFEPLNDALRAHAADGGHIAAICAAPALVLAQAGIIKGRKATCYPGMEAIARSCGAEMCDTPVMVDRNIVTGNGPAAAMRFALTIVAETCGEHVAGEIGAGLLFYPKTTNFYF